eukprot:CAMPEP_0175861996 /NCGR_PEP_ID=MMETSP0107_2-20121207/31699_1 /TAXON_ID=195067 ORGANISM="Goniomonas pacifica, Strain CCMP1869" /NCGR_SAMPLE_ID=MMETSP0107_2 /ASSEMBLY_ACC=CAM_ASM_000203 /LENGTH=111 /DNA_ID=CAMNT_0017178945 /DNA_START=133 /DNA_END=468 /DNA_ORIENTATION=-
MPSLINEPHAKACSFAVLLLHDEGVPITAENIKKLVASVGLEVEPFWPALFAGLVLKEKITIDELVCSISTAPDTCGAMQGGEPETVKENRAPSPCPSEEPEGDLGFSLFD